jgi:hypothetical protein
MFTWTVSERTEFISLLEEIRTSQTAQEFLSISAIAGFLLLNFLPWDSKTDWVLEARDWHPTVEELEDLEGSVLVSDLESLDDEGRDIVREYISDLLSRTPPTEEESLSRLLGYTVNPPYPLHPDLREREARERNLHLQRARDILGPEIWDMKRRCEEMGLFHSELGVDRFFQLVDGGKEMEDTKRTIELKMRHFVAMVEENSHVFGVEERARAREMRLKLGEEERRWEGVKWEVGEREE